MTIEQMINMLISWAVSVAARLVLASIILFIGFKISKIILKSMDKSKGLNKIEPAVKSFVKNTASIGMKVMVLITAASILGLNMTSFITLLGTIGVAVGLSLQGSLSNFAGGVIILVFRPYKVGDYIEASTGAAGTVTDIQIAE